MLLCNELLKSNADVTVGNDELARKDDCTTGELINLYMASFFCIINGSSNYRSTRFYILARPDAVQETNIITGTMAKECCLQLGLIKAPKNILNNVKYKSSLIRR